MDFVQDDSLLAVGMADSHQVALVDTNSWSIKSSILLPAQAVWSIAFSHPDGSGTHQILAVTGSMPGHTAVEVEEGEEDDDGGDEVTPSFRGDKKSAKKKEDKRKPTNHNAGGRNRRALPLAFTDKREVKCFVCNFVVGECVAVVDRDIHQKKSLAKACSFTKEGLLVLADTEGHLLTLDLKGKNRELLWRDDVLAKVTAQTSAAAKDGIRYVAYAESNKKLMFKPIHAVREDDDPSSMTSNYAAFGVDIKVPNKHTEVRGLAFSPNSLLVAVGITVLEGEGRSFLQIRSRKLRGTKEGALGLTKWGIYCASSYEEGSFPGTVIDIAWDSLSERVAVCTKNEIRVFDVRKDVIELDKARRGDGWVATIRDKFPLSWWSSKFGAQSFLNKTETSTSIEKLISQERLDLGKNITTVNALAASHDGRIVAAGGHSIVQLLDTTTRESIGVVTTSSGRPGELCKALAFSPSDRYLAYAGHTKRVFLIDVRSQVVLRDLGERHYLPTSLSFSLDETALVDSSYNKAQNQDITAISVFSVDGSRRTFHDPVDAGSIISSVDAGAIRDFNADRAKNLANLVAKDKSVAFAVLPNKKHTWLKADVSKRLEDDGLKEAESKCRMLDVLVAKREREAIREVLDVVPALALVPMSVGNRPFVVAFNIAVRMRATQTLRTMLLAATRAPVPLRSVVSTELFSLLVRSGMGRVVTDTLKAIDLEPSGCAIRHAVDSLGQPLRTETTLELHETWGGEGSLIWLNYDPNPVRLREAKRASDPRRAAGVENATAERMRALIRVLTYVVSFDFLRYLVELLVHYIYLGFHTVLSFALPYVPDKKIICVPLPMILWGLQPYLRRIAQKYPPKMPKAPEAVDNDAPRPGDVEVEPLRVPLPKLSSKATLNTLLNLGHGTFDNEAMRATVLALWRQHFFFLHVAKSIIVLIAAICYVYYASRISDGWRSLPRMEEAVVPDLSHGEALRVFIAAIALAATSVYSLISEIFQLLGALEANASIVAGIFAYALNLWNIADVFSALSLGWAVFGEVTGTMPMSETIWSVEGLLAIASLFLLTRVVQVLRGFEITGWLITALIQNVKDMAAFLILLGVIVLFFALAFVCLFTHNVGGAIPRERPGVMQGPADETVPITTRMRRLVAGGGDGDAEGTGFESLGPSLLSTFAAGLFGDFDMDTFDEAIDPFAMKLLFILFMVLVGVVALNALMCVAARARARARSMLLAITRWSSAPGPTQCAARRQLRPRPGTANGADPAPLQQLHRRYVVGPPNGHVFRAAHTLAPAHSPYRVFQLHGPAHSTAPGAAPGVDTCPEGGHGRGRRVWRHLGRPAHVHESEPNHREVLRTPRGLRSLLRTPLPIPNSWPQRDVGVARSAIVADVKKLDDKFTDKMDKLSTQVQTVTRTLDIAFQDLERRRKAEEDERARRERERLREEERRMQQLEDSMTSAITNVKAEIMSMPGSEGDQSLAGFEDQLGAGPSTSGPSTSR